jgi:hypothetical protein
VLVHRLLKSGRVAALDRCERALVDADRLLGTVRLPDRQARLASKSLRGDADASRSKPTSPANALRSSSTDDREVRLVPLHTLKLVEIDIPAT